MEIYKEKGLYGEENVYVLKSIEDWDTYEKVLKEKDYDFLKWNSNFYSFKEDFIEYIGKIWQDKNQIRCTLNGVPVYKEYIVIGIEDDNAMADWYWIVQNIQNEKDIKYLLANSCDLRDGING